MIVSLNVGQSTELARAQLLFPAPMTRVLQSILHTIYQQIENVNDGHAPERRA